MKFNRENLQVSERLRRTGRGPSMRDRQGFRQVRPARMWRAGRPVGVGAGGASGIGVPGTIDGHRFAGRAVRAAGLAAFDVRVLGAAGLAVFLRSPWRPLEDRLPRREDQGAGRRAPEQHVGATGAWVQGVVAATNQESALNGLQILWAADGGSLLVAVIEGSVGEVIGRDLPHRAVSRWRDRARMTPACRISECYSCRAGYASVRPGSGPMCQSCRLAAAGRYDGLGQAFITPYSPAQYGAIDGLFSLNDETAWGAQGRQLPAPNSIHGTASPRHTNGDPRPANLG